MSTTEHTITVSSQPAPTRHMPGAHRWVASCSCGRYTSRGYVFGIDAQRAAAQHVNRAARRSELIAAANSEAAS